MADIVKKDQGAYLCFAQSTLVAMRYQLRTGMLYAGHFGTPQVRALRSGGYLP